MATKIFSSLQYLQYNYHYDLYTLRCATQYSICTAILASQSVCIYLSFCSMSLKTSACQFYSIVILLQSLLEGEK